MANISWKGCERHGEIFLPEAETHLYHGLPPKEF